MSTTFYCFYIIILEVKKMYIRKLKDLREDKDLNQNSISKLLNIKQQTYSYYESGKRTIPYELIIKLALFYNTSIDYILELTNEKKAYPRKK